MPEMAPAKALERTDAECETVSVPPEPVTVAVELVLSNATICCVWLSRSSVPVPVNETVVVVGSALFTPTCNVPASMVVAPV